MMLTDGIVPGMTEIALAGEARLMRPLLPVLSTKGNANLDPAAAGDRPWSDEPFRTVDRAVGIGDATDDGRIVNLAWRPTPQAGE